jgi:two-component system CheB/CheR fusion protein
LSLPYPTTSVLPSSWPSTSTPTARATCRRYSRKSPLPVKTVTEHEPLQAGVVFVVPSNRHVNITDSEIDLSSEPSSGQPMPSINLLIETAAEVYGENLIAIVLSGTGTDGTEGARS